MLTAEELERENRSIDRTFAEWEAAVRNGDAEALAALVTEDAEFWSHGAPPLRGREVVASTFRDFFVRYANEQGFEARERLIAEEWAFVRGVEHNQVRPRHGGEPLARDQRAFMVLRREGDGRWRFARGMTNLETPPPSLGGR